MGKVHDPRSLGGTRVTQARREGVRSHTLLLEDRPHPKERPRCRCNGGHPHLYTPTKTASIEEAIGEAWDGPTFEGLVAVRLAFSKGGTVVIVEEYPNAVKPLLQGDIDNYTKTVLDGLNGRAFVDDKQVIYTTASKS